MELAVNESLTLADKIVLDNLRGGHDKDGRLQDEKTVSLLEGLNGPSSPTFLPTIFTTLPEPSPSSSNILWRTYIRWASGVVRTPTDIGEHSVSCKCYSLLISDNSMHSHPPITYPMLIFRTSYTAQSSSITSFYIYALPCLVLFTSFTTSTYSMRSSTGLGLRTHVALSPCSCIIRYTKTEYSSLHIDG